jgi:lipopolysaccharide/colanic/teichoic acid biosynthesis glycosyltransferase
VIRRGLDIVIGLAGAVLSAPLIAVLALAIRLESRGHPIYRQSRVGRDGELFSLLRRYSLDELPNLWNVLRGDMSIVGPRPTLPSQVAQYTARQRGRLAVKPGITGWAQVNGRTSLPWSERIELDLWYVEHRSLRLDLQILTRTVHMVLSGRGLYKGETGGWLPPT